MDFKEFDTFTLNIAQCQSLLFHFLNNTNVHYSRYIYIPARFLIYKLTTNQFFASTYQYLVLYKNALGYFVTFGNNLSSY